MKTIKIFATLLMLFAFTASVNAQILTKDQEKAVKKDVKKYEKDGWKVKPGAPSIAMQLTKSYQMAWENLERKWQVHRTTGLHPCFLLIALPHN